MNIIFLCFERRLSQIFWKLMILSLYSLKVYYKHSNTNALQKFKNQMSQIKYRINTVSSEHHNYPASNLALNQQGWQSQINCSYPQSITLQFYVPIRTKKLHILFHQYKIPKLLEIFVKLGCRSKYRKLGYVIPTDNVQSGFEQKEEKTLYFQFSCTHIMLVMHENYRNDMNIFNQVAIEDIVVIGQILRHKEMSGIYLTEEESNEDEVEVVKVVEVKETVEISLPQRKEIVQISLPQRAIEGESYRQFQQFSSSSTLALFRDIYIKLELEKQEAVEREDYQKASNVKYILGNFHNLENEMCRLQMQKMEALKHQDYDRCHRIKNQISMKREVVEEQREQLFRNQEQFYSHNTYSRMVEKEVMPLTESKKKDNFARDVGQHRSPQTDIKIIVVGGNSAATSHDEEVPPAILKNRHNLQNLPVETYQKRKEVLVLQHTVVVEEQSIEENNSFKKDQIERQVTDRQVEVLVSESVRMELQPLESKLRMRMENYFPFLPEKIWQLCENKNWKGKLQALKVLKEKLPQIETKEQYMAIFEMISRIIVSKQAVISIEALQLLDKLTEMNIKFTLQHLPFFVQDIINQLLNFLNDTNSKIKQLAYITYFHLPHISFLNMSVVIRQLIRHKSKVKNDPKLMITKLQLMTLIIENYHEAEYYFREIMSWMLAHLEDANQKVRSTASELLIALAYLVGSERLLKAIEELKKPQTLQLVLNMLNSSFQHSKGNIQPSKPSLESSKLQQEFYGPEGGKSGTQQVISNKMPSVQPIYVLQSQKKMQLSKQTKKESEQAHFQLSYSRQSIYEQSTEPNKAIVHNYSEAESIRVMEGGDQPEQQSVCIYCMQDYEDEKSHYLNQCRVLAHCDRCNSLIYLREFTDHLINQCEESHLFKMCKKCGLAFQIGEINQHVAKDTCKKKLGVNWERCQFCSVDVMAEDRLWIQHALQCRSLPEKHYRGEINQNQGQSYK